MPTITTTSTNPLLLQVSTSTSIIQLKDILKCGFELEFNQDGETGTETDYDALSDAFYENFDIDDFISWVPNSEDEPLLLVGYRNQEYLSIKGQDRYESLLDGYRDHWQEEHRSDYQIALETEDPSYDSDLVELGGDSSVTGGELRTIGALSPVDFVKAADSIFFENHTVDQNCSFHVHLSIEGIQHSYGKRFQAEMLGYLLLNKNKTIVDRLNSSATRYFKTELTENKFTAVHFHSVLKTWEFRIFGGIKNKETQKKCLLLAYQAYRHACAHKISLEPSVFGNLSLSAIEELLPDISDKNNQAAKEIVKKTIVTIPDLTIYEVGA